MGYGCALGCGVGRTAGFSTALLADTRVASVEMTVFLLVGKKDRQQQEQRLGVGSLYIPTLRKKREGWGTRSGWLVEVRTGNGKYKDNCKCKCKCKCNGNGKYNDRSWQGKGLHSHLSRDKAAAKMGHPIVYVRNKQRQVQRRRQVQKTRETLDASPRVVRKYVLARRGLWERAADVGVEILLDGRLDDKDDVVSGLEG